MMRAGEVYVNPASGERAVVVLGTDETEGERLVVDLHLRPGGGMLGRHYHPLMHETFRVMEGSVSFTLNGNETTAQAGESVDIPPGALHDFWNPGAREALVRVDVRPAARFAEMIKNGFGLAQDGKTDSKGMPSLLQVSLFAREFDDVIRYDKGPRAVQKALFSVLAPLAGWMGLEGNYEKYRLRPATETVPMGALDRTGL